MGTTAKLTIEVVTDSDHTDLGTVLLTEERDRTRALGLIERHDLSGHRKIFCKLFVNKAFDFVQLAFAKRT